MHPTRIKFVFVLTVYSVQTHTASSPVGTGGFFPRGEADHSTAACAEAKEGVAILPLPSIPSLMQAACDQNRNRRE
jgi:hypothetical protein